MEIPIKDRPYSILLGYDGSNETKNDINTNAQNGVDTIVIGNVTDITLMKTMEACADKDLRSYIGSLNGYAKMSGLTYIPGERDFRLYTELKEIIDECRERKHVSSVSSFRMGRVIKDIQNAEIKNKRTEFSGVYDELSELAGKCDVNFLYLIKSIMILGKQPIYTIRKNEDDQYLLISHASPQGKIISDKITAESLANNAPTINDIADKKLRLIRGSSVGSTHRSLTTSINNMLIKYLLDPEDPMRTDILDALSNPYGGER